MTELGINVDHVATVREARGIDVPDPVEAASLAERNGADGIVLHLRKDRRHVQERDLRTLRETVKTRLNLEMAVTDKMIEIAQEVKPDRCTLVPEERDEVTTEGGLDVLNNQSKLDGTVKELQNSGIYVSLFVDPDPEQLEASKQVGANGVELHTGDYAETTPQSSERQEAIDRLERAAELVDDMGLDVFAGHGLNYRNVQSVASIDPIEELNIGHSVVARSVMVGIDQATRKMKKIIRRANT